MRNDPLAKSGVPNADRLVSPEAMGEAIQVVSPGAWLTVAALLVVFAAVLVWGFTGTLPQTITAGCVGSADGATATCYIPVSEYSDELVGCEVVVTLPDDSRAPGRVQSESERPLSKPEIAALTDSDWLVDMLVNADYSYQVTIQLDEQQPMAADEVMPAAVVIAEIPPIDLLFGVQDKVV